VYGFREYEVIFLIDIKTLDAGHREEGERRYVETISVAFILSDDFHSRYNEHDEIDVLQGCKILRPWRAAKKAEIAGLASHDKMLPHCRRGE
jgi:hypothetical protein